MHYLDRQMVLPIICETFVEFSVLLCGDVIRVSCPNGLGLVQFLLINILLLDLLLLLLILVLGIFLVIRTDILNFRLVLTFLLVFLFFGLFFLSLIITDLLITLFFDLQTMSKHTRWKHSIF